MNKFDWSGAPEGERYMWGPTPYVINGDRVYVHITEVNGWECSEFDRSVSYMRGKAGDNLIPVEPARPVVRVGDRIRVTVEGAVTALLTDEIIYKGDLGVGGFVTTGESAATVEVLQRADPPLEPGDLVRAGGAVWQLTQDGRFSPVLDTEGDAAWDSSYRTRDQITGPLVKVELREVTS